MRPDTTATDPAEAAPRRHRLWPDFSRIRKEQSVSLEHAAKKTADENPDPEEETAESRHSLRLSGAPGKEGPGPVVRTSGKAATEPLVTDPSAPDAPPVAKTP